MDAFLQTCQRSFQDIVDDGPPSSTPLLFGAGATAAPPLPSGAPVAPQLLASATASSCSGVPVAHFTHPYKSTMRTQREQQPRPSPKTPPKAGLPTQVQQQLHQRLQHALAMQKKQQQQQQVQQQPELLDSSPSSPSSSDIDDDQLAVNLFIII